MNKRMNESDQRITH